MPIIKIQRASWHESNLPNNKIDEQKPWAASKLKSSSDQESDQDNRPDAWSWQTEFSLSYEYKCTFAQLLWPEKISLNFFSELLAFKTLFKEQAVQIDNFKDWFIVKTLAISDTETHASFEVTAQKNNDGLTDSVLMDMDIIVCNQTLTANNNRLRTLVAENKHPVSLELKEEMKLFSVKDEILYSNNHIKVCNDDTIKAHILKSWNNSKLARNPGEAKTLSLPMCSFTWISMTA